MAKRNKPNTTEQKILKLLAARDAGKAKYAEADVLLEEIVGDTEPGQVLDLGGGFRAEVVDNFATKNKAWKPCGINRFDLKVTRA